MAVEGAPEPGMAAIRDGLGAASATGTRQFQPYLHGVLADACVAAGRIPEGLAAVRSGLDAAQSTNERFYEAELHRLEGELERARGADSGRSVAAFEHSIEVAQRQAAHLLELRALVSLMNGRGAQARSGELQPHLVELLERLGPQCDGVDAREARLAAS
jgi:predicted ATPase